MANASIPIDETYLTETLQALVRINSVNPSLIPGAPGEAEIAASVGERLEALGLTASLDEVAPGRFNATGLLPGAGGGRSLLLNAHMDTVGVEGMHGDPFSGEVRHGRLYGRGAEDMKASLAATLAAVKALRDQGVRLAGDLIVAGVADEEFASLGTEALVKTWHADGAIVTEPSSLAVCRAHRGYAWYEIVTTGRAAHGSRYMDGIDANMHMGRVLSGLEVLASDLVQRPPHPLMGPPSMHAAVIQGGREPSVYADRCTLQVERRTIAGEDEADMRAELQAILDRNAAKDPQFKAELRLLFERPPFEVDASAGIVQAVDGAARQVLGRPPQHSGQTFWTDAALLAAAGMETVLIGPHGQGLHSAEEWVDLESVVQLAGILAHAAMAYCGTA